MLWFSENFLRYEQTERLYLGSLTMAPESARVLLRQAVKIESKRGDSPTPKYLEALAEREEDDLVLPTYEKAYAVSPANSFLAIRYGCRLFGAGRWQDAGALFSEASAHPPRNALPMYLEAAARLRGPGDALNLSGSLAQVAKTNNSALKVIFPPPLWFSGLPQAGECYAALRRQAIDECCAPLYEYTRWITSAAERDIAQNRVQYWDLWLETLQTMGERLVTSAEPGTVQATAGVHIQLAALQLRERIYELEKGQPSEKLIERRIKLQTANGWLSRFLESRDVKIEADRLKYKFPLGLCGWTLAALVAVYILSCAAGRIVRGERRHWNVPHTGAGRAMMIGGSAVFLALLLLTMALQRVSASQDSWMRTVLYLWWGTVAGLLIFGALYPFLTLTRPAEAAGNAAKSDGMDDVLRLARKERRKAAGVLRRRYYGVILGGFLSAVSFWAVIHRVLLTLYPWQLGLLTTGLGAEEVQVVNRVVALLH